MCKVTERILCLKFIGILKFVKILELKFMDCVLSHWVHFTVHSLDLVVFICVYFLLLFFILHICCVIVSAVGWT